MTSDIYPVSGAEVIGAHLDDGTPGWFERGDLIVRAACGDLHRVRSYYGGDQYAGDQIAEASLAWRPEGVHPHPRHLNRRVTDDELSRREPLDATPLTYGARVWRLGSGLAQRPSMLYELKWSGVLHIEGPMGRGLDMFIVDESPAAAAATALRLREGWANRAYLAGLDMAMRGEWELAENCAKTAMSVAAVSNASRMALLIVSLRRQGLSRRADMAASTSLADEPVRAKWLAEAERFESFLRKQGV